MNNPRAIFFDAAGTLFHLRESVGKTYAEIGVAHGVVADAGLLDKGFRTAWKGLPVPVHAEGTVAADDDRSWWEELVRRTFHNALLEAPDPAHIEPVFEDLYQHYAYAAAWQLFDDVIPALEKLRKGRTLLVLSNFDKRLRNILEGLEIGHYFDHIIVSSEVGAWKPDPRMFRAALQAALVPPEDCLHVGDDARCDEEGARATGVASFLVRRPEVTLSSLVEKMSHG